MTTIQDIAGSVDASVGLLYNYFESKDKLYEELVQYGGSGPNGMMDADSFEPLQFFETSAKTILTILENETVSRMFLFMAQALNDDGLSPEVKLLLGGIANI